MGCKSTKGTQGGCGEASPGGDCCAPRRAPPPQGGENTISRGYTGSDAKGGGTRPPLRPTSSRRAPGPSGELRDCVCACVCVCGGLWGGGSPLLGGVLVAGGVISTFVCPGLSFCYAPRRPEPSLGGCVCFLCGFFVVCCFCFHSPLVMLLCSFCALRFCGRDGIFAGAVEWGEGGKEGFAGHGKVEELMKKRKAEGGPLNGEWGSLSVWGPAADQTTWGGWAGRGV